MRWLFLILLTVNLGVLLWYTQIGVHQEQAKYPAMAKDVKRLVLLSETRPAQSEELDETAADQNDGESSTVETGNEIPLPEIDVVNAKPVITKPVLPAFTACYTIGPFKEKDRIKNVKKQLSTLGITIKQRTSVESELYGYRVYIPPLPSREAALKITKELASHKINDYFIIQDQEKRNGVSLGLFRKKSGAIRRMAQVRRFGFKPVMEVRNRERDIFWLDLEQKQDMLTDDVWSEISEGQPELQRLERDCGS